jgi:hypothetical protein
MTESKANEAAGAADHATGYGKPPPITRFREGQSAIPQGGKGCTPRQVPTAVSDEIDAAPLHLSPPGRGEDVTRLHL